MLAGSLVGVLIRCGLAEAEKQLRHRFVRWLAAFAALGLAFSLLYGLAIEWESVVRALIGGLMGALIANHGLFFLRQLEKIRRGLFSFTAMFLAWRRCLLSCHNDPPFRPRSEVDTEIAKEAR